MVDDVATVPERRGADERVGSSAALVSGVGIGKYEILGVLGQGGFGITYRARDTQLGREVAIKEYLPTVFAVREQDGLVLPRSTQVAEDFRWGRQRFLDEARTLALLEEAPGIARVHELLEANGTAYMVMALVRGETLEARLKRGHRLTQQTIDQFLPPLLHGLERVHQAGFLHRDIKPANVLLDAEGRPTRIDFGASRVALQGRTQAMTAVYTPGYAAFEQFTSAKQGAPADIYGLAATIYHCITGAPPPPSSDRMIEDRLVPAGDAGRGRYAPSLLAAIDAGLKLKAGDRPQTIADWRRILSIGSRSTDERPSSATRVIDEPAPRPMDATSVRAGKVRPAWQSLAASVVALAIAVGVGWMVLRGPEPAADPVQRRAAPREDEAARQRAAAEAQHKAEEEAARKAAEEKAATERRAAEAAAARKAEDEARREAGEKAKTELEAKRQAEAGEAALRLSPEGRKRVQVALTALGYNTQGGDGNFGPRTRAMIAAWQKSQKAPETGYLTAPQLAALSQQGASAIARYDEEQKKLEEARRKQEEEVRRNQEEDARKRAAEERRLQEKIKECQQLAERAEDPLWAKYVCEQKAKGQL